MFGFLDSSDELEATEISLAAKERKEHKEDQSKNNPGILCYSPSFALSAFSRGKGSSV